MALVPVLQPPVMRLLTSQSILIYVLGAFSFLVATAGGVIFAKVMNLFLKPRNKINPPNVAGVIGSAVAAGILFSYLL